MMCMWRAHAHLCGRDTQRYSQQTINGSNVRRHQLPTGFPMGKKTIGLPGRTPGRLGSTDAAVVGGYPDRAKAHMSERLFK